MKLVMYFGNIPKANGCSKCASLLTGRIYEVCSIRIERKTETTYYTLKGIEGEFKSTLFEDISTMPTYFAVSSMLPVVGEIYYCHKINVLDSQGKVQVSNSRTSLVRWFELISHNTYKVVTENSIFIVTIMQEKTPFR